MASAATELPAVTDGLSRYDRHRLQAGLRRLAETGASTLEVARAAVWLYGEGRERLHRIHLYHRSSGEHVAGGELRREHFPAYFEALDEGALLVVADVHGDPRTAELSEPYAAPLGISSWIDAPLSNEGEGGAPPGILRLEHLGPPRSWSAREHSVARALASSTGALLEYFDARRGSSAGPGRDGPPGEAPPADRPAEEETESSASDDGAAGPERVPWGGVRDGAGRRARRMKLENLAGAAADGRLALRWQPIQRASDGTRVGAEALLRMQWSAGEELSPASEFVLRAEETGAIAAMDRWVLERAAARAAAWRRSGAIDWIALNVSPLSLLEDGYRSALRTEVEERGLGPSAVLVQVALDMDRHPTVDVGRALFSLWEAGFGVCLDLSGAGDELMEIALAGLPADVLEVTPEMLERWDGRRLPAGIQEGRRDRGLRLLAKKLETSDQERRAKAMDCEFLSGRLLGPPAAAEELLEVTGAAHTRSAGRPGPGGS